MVVVHLSSGSEGAELSGHPGNGRPSPRTTRRAAPIRQWVPTPQQGRPCAVIDYSVLVELTGMRSTQPSPSIHRDHPVDTNQARTEWRELLATACPVRLRTRGVLC